MYLEKSHVFIMYVFFFTSLVDRLVARAASLSPACAEFVSQRQQSVDQERKRLELEARKKRARYF